MQRSQEDTLGQELPHNAGILPAHKQQPTGFSQLACMASEVGCAGTLLAQTRSFFLCCNWVFPLFTRKETTSLISPAHLATDQSLLYAQSQEKRDPRSGGAV